MAGVAGGVGAEGEGEGQREGEAGRSRCMILVENSFLIFRDCPVCLVAQRVRLTATAHGARATCWQPGQRVNGELSPGGFLGNDSLPFALFECPGVS